MNKSLYQFCQRKFKTLTHGQLKLSSSLTRLNSDYGFGVIDAGYLHFNEQDRASLIDRVCAENGVHLFRDLYPAAQSRQQQAQTQRNEKDRRYAVSRDFILINSLQTLQLNKQQFPVTPLTSLGVYLKADQIISVEHKQIVMVENLAIMANLSALNMPESLQNALWLYRGDAKKQQQTGTAYQFFRRFTASDYHQLICFSDLDPKGIEIALTCGADYWLTPEDSTVINMTLEGAENEWHDQGDTIRSLERKKEKNDLPEKCKAAFSEMCGSRKTLKQEHMFAHAIKLNLYNL